MAADRSAHYTIAGYHYQFDKSILEILRGRPNARVELEAVEDVDVEGECIQVKYHATQKYTPSKVQQPLVAFLKHHRDKGGETRYRLYAHFADTSAYKAIDMAELKAILGDEWAKLGLSESKLRAFLKDHFAFEQANDLDTQQAMVLTELGTALHAPRIDCEQYYYNNALYEVFRLARQATVAQRTTTRTAFIRAINRKSLIFARWLAEMRGQKDYRKLVRDELKAADALRSNKRRFVLLARSLIDASRAEDIAAFCRTLADRFYELGKVLYDAVPLTVIIERPRDEVTAVQRELLGKGILLNTGYEAIGFQPALFNEPPIINRESKRGGKAGDQVASASFRLGVISAVTYKNHRTQIDPPDSFFYCGRPDASDPVSLADGQLFVISDVKDLAALLRILAK